jgi:hypothetical protein
LDQSLKRYQKYAVKDSLEIYDEIYVTNSYY